MNVLQHHVATRIEDAILLQQESHNDVIVVCSREFQHHKGVIAMGPSDVVETCGGSSNTRVLQHFLYSGMRVFLQHKGVSIQPAHRKDRSTT